MVLDEFEKNKRLMKRTEIIKDLETPQFIYFKVWWLETHKTATGLRVDKHEHSVCYDKTIGPLLDRFVRCDCTFHSFVGVNDKKWCRVIKKAALWCVSRGILDSIVREWILGQ
jgi:hypothetical protein